MTTFTKSNSGTNYQEVTAPYNGSSNLVVSRSICKTATSPNNNFTDVTSIIKINGTTVATYNFTTPTSLPTCSSQNSLSHTFTGLTIQPGDTITIGWVDNLL